MKKGNAKSHDEMKRILNKKCKFELVMNLFEPREGNDRAMVVCMS